jgi:hypothetical protein
VDEGRGGNMNATTQESTTAHAWPTFVLWFRQHKLDRWRAWRQVATAATERAAWEKATSNGQQGEFMVLPEGYEP